MSDRKKPQVFVNLDGVLVNFHRSACPLFGVPYPSKEVLHFGWLFDKLGITISDFISRVDRTPGFWEDLKPFSWTPELVQMLDELFPTWQILTSGTRDPVSWAGKVIWTKRFFGETRVSRLVMVHGDKSRVASGNSLLVDDHKEWCQNWEAAGGLGAFHWLEYSDDHEELWKKQLADLRVFLEKFSG